MLGATKTDTTRGRRAHLGMVLAVAAAACLPAAAWGWASLEETGASAAVGLKMPTSPRLLALGGAGTADAGGAGAWWFNPAAPGAFPGVSLEAAFRDQGGDTEYGFFTLCLPVGWGTPSLGLLHRRTVDIPGYDETGAATGSFATQDTGARFGWAWAAGPVSFGFSGLYIREELGTATVSGWGGDLGVLVRAGHGLQVGAAVLRLGESELGDPLPSEIRLGMQSLLLPALTGMVDVALPRDAEAYLAGGVEYAPWPALALRAGWRNGPASSWHLGELAYFAGGLGLNLGGVALDYAYEPAGVLGESHHLSLRYHFSPPPAHQASPSDMTAREPDEFLTASPRPADAPRAFEGKMTFNPQNVAERFDAKSITFKIRNQEGRIVRTFDYAGKALPRELVWDGRDDTGQRVAGNQSFTVDMEYATDEGVRRARRAWPNPQPAAKLRFEEGGEDVAPEVLFRFSGPRDLRYWKLVILPAAGGEPVREFSARGKLPEFLEWDGRDAQGGFAPADRAYAYRLEMMAPDFAEMTLEKPIVPVPAEVVARTGGRVRFKILGVVFDFASSKVRGDNADKLAKAAEIAFRNGRVTALEGHADEVGSAKANLYFSRRRAMAVQNYLRRLDVPGAARAETRGFGNTRPVVVGAASETGREPNRRCEIVMEVPPKR